MNGNGKYFESNDNELISAEILEFARNYQAEDFPNQERKGCPSKDLLVDIIRKGELPDDNLRTHLMQCSPCFQEFRNAKQNLVTVAQTETFEKKKYFRLPVFSIPVLAAVSIILLIGFVGAVIYYNNPPSKDETVQEKKPEFVENIANNSNNNAGSEIPETLIGSKKESEFPENKVKAFLEKDNKLPKNLRDFEKKSVKQKTEVYDNPNADDYFEFDIAKAAVYRSSSAKERIYKLPGRKTFLNFKLLSGSPLTDFEISLLSEWGEPLEKTVIKNTGGKYLKTNFDLTKHRGRVRLCIAPVGEIPDCFPVIVGK